LNKEAHRTLLYSHLIILKLLTVIWTSDCMILLVISDLEPRYRSPCWLAIILCIRDLVAPNRV